MLQANIFLGGGSLVKHRHSYNTLNLQILNQKYHTYVFFFRPDFISPSHNNISVHLFLKEGCENYVGKEFPEVQ